MVNRTKATLLSLLLLLGVVGISVGAAMLKNHMVDQAAPAVASVQPLYGVQGLPYGRALSQEILAVDEANVYFSDRVLERFYNDEQGNQRTAQSIATFFGAVPEGVNKTVLLFPMRIHMETEYAQYTDDVAPAMEQIAAGLPEDVAVLDATDRLYQHREEYIYFRTDDCITALGGYYGAQLLGEKLGLNMLQLSDYEEYRFESFKGVLDALDQAQIDEDCTDYVAYYLRKGAANWQTVTVREGPDQYSEHESPAVALSRRGTDIFIGGYYSHSILQGDGGNGKTLLIVGNSDAKFFAPWFTPYYDTVYLVNAERYQGGQEGFAKIFETYQVSDCILIESADKFGDTALNQRLARLGGGK